MKAVESAYNSKASFIAGSITSLEDCYRPDLFPGQSAAEDSYGETLMWFKEAGIEIILFETMGHLEEIEIALKAASDFSKIWLSLIIKDSSHLLSGHSLEDVYVLSADRVGCMLLNCNTFDKSNDALVKFKEEWNGNWGIYPNLGESEPEPDGAMDQKIDDGSFESMIANYMAESPAIIGSCCGSSPKHTVMIRKILDKKLLTR